MFDLLTLLACAGLANAIAYPGPQPTGARLELQHKVEDVSPKPTNIPNRFLRRDMAPESVCGYYYNDDFMATRAIMCQTGACMMYTSKGIDGMAGCCTSTAGGIDYQNCGWTNKCYDYNDLELGRCDGLCMANNFHRVCSDVAAPHCQSWTYAAHGVKDYGCGTASASTWTTLEDSMSDISSGAVTAQVPYAPATVTMIGISDATGFNSRTSTGTSRATATDTVAIGGFSYSTKSATVPLIIILVIALLCLCCAGGIVTWFCIRSKRNVAKWGKASAVNTAAVTGQQAAPLMHNQQSNVIPPAGAYGDHHQQSYFGSQPVPPAGAAVEYYSAREQKSAAYSTIQPPAAPSAPSTPAPPYMQPYHTPPPQSGMAEAPSHPAGRQHYSELS